MKSKRSLIIIAISLALVLVLIISYGIFFPSAEKKREDYYASKNVLVAGYEKGKWTMDFQAAVRYAQANNKFIFILFTGSDWDSLSLEMENKVFATQKWKDYADENFALVYLDFPQEDTGLSEQQKKLNEALSKRYNIQEFPGLIVIPKSGEGMQGNFIPNTNVDSFMKDLERIK